MRSMRRCVQRYLGSQSGWTNWMQLNLWILWRMIVFACSQLGGVLFRDFRIFHSAGVVWPFSIKHSERGYCQKSGRSLQATVPIFSSWKWRYFHLWRRSDGATTFIIRMTMKPQVFLSTSKIGSTWTFYAQQSRWLVVTNALSLLNK